MLLLNIPCMSKIYKYIISYLYSNSIKKYILKKCVLR